MKIYVNMLNITTGNNEWVLIKDDPLALGGGDNYRGIYRIFDRNNGQIGVIDNDGIDLIGPQGIQMQFSNSEGLNAKLNNNPIFWANDQEMGATALNATQIFDLGGRLRAMPMQKLGDNDQIINRGVGIIATQESGGN